MPNIAQDLAKQSVHFGVSSAYGDQQDVDGVRIIPVAATWHGFGAYIRRGDDLRFEPNVIALLAVGIPFVWAAGRALSRVIRALKK